MEKKILDLFLFENQLKFNDIERSLNIRSNKLAYHLKNLLIRGILKKEGEEYSLSDTSEYLIPYLSEKKAVLPVVLVHLGNKRSCFLYPRKKRPFKDKLSLPGGRLIIGESIPEGTKRIMGKKFHIESNFKKIHSISLEHVRKSGRIIHSFLLIFVSSSTKQKVQLTDIKKNKSKIIKSDYNLITNGLNKTAQINQLYTPVF